MEERTTLGDRWAAASPVRRRMRPLVWADPRATIGEAADLLAGADDSCVLVRLPGGLGIATDHDFRMALADATLSREAALSAICSVPAVTVNEHTDAPTALVMMVERGIHHLVVTTDTDNPVGVVRVVDLASAGLRDPLLVRRYVARARSLDDLREAAVIVPQTVLEMDEMGMPALRVSGILSTVRDLIVQRVAELTPTAVPTSHVSWLVLGSLARREALPHSDVDTALAWPAALDIRAPQLRADAELVLRGLERCGLARCPDGANATEELFSRSVDDWEAATHRWTHHPESESALLLASIVADNRPVTHVDLGSALTQSMLTSTRDRTFLSALLSFTLAVRPSRGLISDFTVAHTGPHRGQLDLKRGGLWPVVLLGRWMALAVGATPVARPSTAYGAVPSRDSSRLARPRTSSAPSRRSSSFASTRRSPPWSPASPSDSYLAPGAIDPLRRRYLHDSLRAISAIQTAVGRTWASRQEGPAGHGRPLGTCVRSRVTLGPARDRLVHGDLKWQVGAGERTAAANAKESVMKALVYHGPGQKAWEEVPDPDDPEADGRHRPGRHHHDLRHRPAHPQGRRPGRHRRPHPRPRGRRHGHRDRLRRLHDRGRRPGAHLVHQRLRQLLVLPPGSLRPLPRRRGRVRHRLDPRPPHRRDPGGATSGCRSPTTPCTSCRPASADEAAVMLSDILPTGFEIGVRYGRVKPGDVVAVVGAGPVGLAAIMTAGLYGAARIIALDLDANRLEKAKVVRCHRRREQRRRGLDRPGQGDDRRLRRRRGDRGRRHPGDVRRVHEDRPPRRVRRERRRARRAGGARPAGPLDHGHHHHHGPGQHQHHADAAEAGRPAQARRRVLRDAPLHRSSNMLDAYDTFGRAAETKALKVVIKR